jgi:hypothetical protein
MQYVIGGVLLGTTLALAGSAGLYLLLGRQRDSEPAPETAPAVTSLDSTISHDDAVDSVSVSPNDPNPVGGAGQVQPPTIADSDRTVQKEQKQPPAKTADQPAAAGDPFQYLQKLGNRLEIPRPVLVSAGATVEEPRPLVRLAIKAPTDCRLDLFDIDNGPTIAQLKLGDPEDRAGENARRWAVIRQSPRDAGGEDVTLGYFQLRGESLSFAWAPDPPESARPQDLQLCLLQISISGQSRKCSLCLPIRWDPLKLDLEKERFEVDLPKSLASLDRFQFEVWLEGERNTERQKLVPESSVEFKANCPVGSDIVPVSVRLSLRRQTSSEPTYRMNVEYFLNRQQVRGSRLLKKSTVRAPATLEDARKEKELTVSMLSRCRKELDAKNKGQAKAARRESAIDDPSGRALDRKSKSDAKLAEEIDKLQESIDTLSSAVEWNEQLLESLNLLQNRCRIGLEAIVINQGMRIELLSTKTASPANAQE